MLVNGDTRDAGGSEDCEDCEASKQTTMQSHKLHSPREKTIASGSREAALVTGQASPLPGPSMCGCVIHLWRPGLVQGRWCW